MKHDEFARSPKDMRCPSCFRKGVPIPEYQYWYSSKAPTGYYKCSSHYGCGCRGFYSDFLPGGKKHGYPPLPNRY